ncbi:MAG: hypothetical protein IMZ46_02300 [Acidobacteria bacterium]|nr:hypothetical protein [Acidobacteriota bacterium]
MITSRDLKRPPITEGIRLRHLTSMQVPKRTGGPFNFDKGRFVNVKKRTPNRPKGAIFSADLRAVQEAKERKEKAAAIAQSKAIRAKKLADAKAAKKVAQIVPFLAKKDVETHAKKMLADALKAQKVTKVAKATKAAKETKKRA